MLTKTSPSPILLVPLLALWSGCGDDSAAGDETGGSDATAAAEASGGADAASAADTTAGAADDGTSAADSSGSGGPDIAALYDCEEPELMIAQPLAGPGIDPETGALLDPIAGEYIVHTTQILPKSDADSQQAFFGLVGAISAQLMQTPGLVGFSLAVEPNCAFARTLGVWESEEAMYAFVSSGAHLDAMGQTFDVGVTGRVTHWTATAEELPPSWESAVARLSEVDPLGGY